MATTSAARKTKSQESSTCGSALVPVLPSISQDMNSVDSERWLTFPEAHGHPLLPGIPNDIIFAHIVPKLAWRHFYILSAVSPAWCHAIRSRQVYDARVKAGSTEMLVMFRYMASDARPGIALYSVKDDSCVNLPLDPILVDDISPTEWTTWIGLEGKIYLLSRFHLHRSEGTLAYVFDLAGQRRWQKFPTGWQIGGDVETRRYLYSPCEYVVLDGKMYAVGGCTCTRCPGSKVYDPVENIWSRMKSLGKLRFMHGVAVGGDEIYVYGGLFIAKPDYLPIEMAVGSDFLEVDRTLDVYHILRDEWRTVDEFRTPYRGTVFMAQGKLHAMTADRIDVYSIDTKWWTTLHQQSFDMTELIGCIADIRPRCVVSYGDELLAIVEWERNTAREKIGTCLVRSKGFGGDIDCLVWRKAQIPAAFAHLRDQCGLPFLSPFQL